MQRALFLGPDKGGSSWIHRLFDWHPAIAVPTTKELRFFNRFYHRGIDWYEAQIPVTGDTEVAAEMGTDYLFQPEAIARIHKHYPNAVLFVTLRHPLQRAVSSYLYKRRQGRIRGDLHTALREDEGLLWRGRYAQHITPILDLFPKEQLVLLDFDDLQADPQQFADQLLEAVGLTPTTVPSELLEPVRPASEARFQPIATLAHWVAKLMREARLEAWLGRLNTNPLVHRLLVQPLSSAEKPRPSTTDWMFARDMLLDDTRRLDEMLDTDYTGHWWSV